MANPLNPLRFPLYGERLIEASAGTGKTYTIAGLYLRLLLGHGPVIEQAGEEGGDAGQPCAHERPLSVTEQFKTASGVIASITGAVADKR